MHCAWFRNRVVAVSDIQRLFRQCNRTSLARSTGHVSSLNGCCCWGFRYQHKPCPRLSFSLSRLLICQIKDTSRSAERLFFYERYWLIFSFCWLGVFRCRFFGNNIMFSDRGAWDTVLRCVDFPQVLQSKISLDSKKSHSFTLKLTKKQDAGYFSAALFVGYASYVTDVALRGKRLMLCVTERWLRMFILVFCR